MICTTIRNKMIRKEICTSNLLRKSRNSIRDIFSISGLTAIALAICIAWLPGCNRNGTPQSDQQLKENAAKTTEQVKQGAQQAAADAKTAAANAERKADDIAAGVKEGLNNGKQSGAVDINSASTTRLETLPGISPARAQRIVDNRPYNSPHDLVAKGVVSEAEYARLSGKVAAD